MTWVNVVPAFDIAAGITDVRSAAAGNARFVTPSVSAASASAFWLVIGGIDLGGGPYAGGSGVALFVQSNTTVSAHKFLNQAAPNALTGTWSPSQPTLGESWAITNLSAQTIDGAVLVALTIGAQAYTFTATDPNPNQGHYFGPRQLFGFAVFEDVTIDQWVSAPGAPTDPTSANITDTGALLSCTAPTTGGAVLSYEVDVREVGTTPWTTIPSGGPSIALTIFETATNYEFRWRALGSGATVSPDSATASFWTANNVSGGGEISGPSLRAPALRVSEWVGGSMTIKVRAMLSGQPAAGETVLATSADASKVTLNAAAIADSNGYATFNLVFVSGGRSLLTFSSAGLSTAMLAITRTIQAS